MEITKRNTPQPRQPAPIGRESTSNFKGGAEGRDLSEFSVRLKD